jgi:hypothetical protein
VKKFRASPTTKPRPEIILCRDDGRVALFISVNDYHLNSCGSPEKDWRYLSPKSICLGTESGRGTSAGHLIKLAQCLAKMTGYKLRDELVSCDLSTMGRDMRQ